MRLTKLRIRNFLSFGDEQVIDLDDQGLVLIEGVNEDEPRAAANGAGKSAIPKALTWCLFGVTFDGLRGDEVINRWVKRDCEVALEFERAGRHYRVARGRRTSAGRVSLQLWADGQEVSASDIRDTQRLLQSVIGTTHEVFINTVVFGQTQKWRFAELGDAGQKAILDRILGLESIERALQWTKEARRDHEEILTRVRTDHASAMATLKATRDLARSERTQLLDARAVALARCIAEIKRIRSRLAELSNNPPGIKQASPVTSQSLARAKHDLEKAREVRTLVARDLGRAEAAHEASQARMVKVVATAGATCDACGAEVTQDRLAAHMAHLEAQCAEAKKLLDECSRAYRSAQVAVSQAQERYAKLTSQQEVYREQQAVRQQAVGQRTELVARLRELKAERVALKGSDPKVSRTTRQRVRKAQRDLERAALDLEAAELTTEHLDFWVQGFGNAGIKSHYLDHVIPVLNQRVQQYAALLSEGITVEFTPQRVTSAGEVRDKLQIVAHNEWGADSYAGNSGGERRKIDIAIACALQSLEAERTAMPCNLVFWDEVFESLDEVSCEAVMRLLREQLNSGKSSVFVISHLTWLRDHFTRVLRVTKRDRYSRVEEI